MVVEEGAEVLEALFLLLAPLPRRGQVQQLVQRSYLDSVVVGAVAPVPAGKAEHLFDPLPVLGLGHVSNGFTLLWVGSDSILVDEVAQQLDLLLV